MSQMIHSKLHEALTVAAEGTKQRGKKSSDEVNMLLEECTELPLYVMDGSLVDNLSQADLTKTMGALYEAGVMRLPFPKMAIELWSDTSKSRLFMWLMEDEPGRFKAAFVQWTEAKNKNQQLSLLVRAQYEWNHALPDPQAGQNKRLYWHDDSQPGSGRGWKVKFMTGDSAIDNADEPPEALARCIENVSAGIILAITMTNIGGVERETIDPSRLNKHRALSGKGKIHTHTIVRLGHVYDKSGKRVPYARGSSDGTRKPTIVHMRAAHTRRQQHGDDFLESEDGKRYAGLSSTTSTHHIVLINAVLVNYKDGTDLAKPLPKLVKY